MRTIRKRGWQLPRKTLTVNEAAEELGISPKAVRRRIERRTLQAIRRDGRLLIPIAELEKEGYTPEPYADIPDREVWEDAKEAWMTAGREQGMRQIEREAHSQEVELREQIAQERNNAQGLQARLDSVETQEVELRERIMQERNRAQGLQARLDYAETQVNELTNEKAELAEAKEELAKALDTLEALLRTLPSRHQKRLAAARQSDEETGLID